MDAQVRHMAGLDLLGRIATGASSDVFLARRSGGFGFAKLVAVKCLHAEAAQRRQRFSAAWRELANLADPAVAEILDCGVAQGGIYSVTEYVHGETLAALLARAKDAEEPMRWGVVAFVGAAIAHALHHLRTRRGAAPAEHEPVSWTADASHVLLGYDGAVKLVGFTAAEEHDEDGAIALRAVVELLRRVRGAAASPLDEICDEVEDRAFRGHTLLELARRLDTAAYAAGVDRDAVGEEVRCRFAAERARKESLIQLSLSARASVTGLVMDRIALASGPSPRRTAPLPPPPALRGRAPRWAGLLALACVALVSVKAMRRPAAVAQEKESPPPPVVIAPACPSPPSPPHGPAAQPWWLSLAKTR